MIFIFIQPHFIFNGKYSKDMNMCITTMDNDMLNNIGVEYSSDIEIETNLVEYNPYFKENPSDTNEIELNLLLYNPYTFEALSIDKYNMDEIYEWLITDNFAPFISDDDWEITYYFKVVKLSKVLTFDGKGYLRVTFKPYSKYCYRRKEYTLKVEGSNELVVYNDSRLVYKPIIKVTNLGDTPTVNKINNMEITGLQNGEVIIIDNLTKLIQTKEGVNKFSCCNAKWIHLLPRENNTLTLEGNFELNLICEFPIFY